MINPRTPGIHSIKKPANHPRSDAMNAWHTLTNSPHHTQQKPPNGCCASAESSTCSPPGSSSNMQHAEESLCCNHLPEAKPAIAVDAAHLHLNHQSTAAAAHATGLVKSRPVQFDSRRDLRNQHSSVIAISTGRIKPELCADNEAKISAGPSGGANIVGKGVICSMCGDVGIADLLFVCSKCTHRHQHIYCSRSYPNVGEEAYVCNWCLYEQDSMASTGAKAASKRPASTNWTEPGQTVTPIIELYCPMISHADRRTECQLGSRGIAEENEDDDVMVKKGHTKAFEYLLLVAAQSLLDDHNRAKSDANTANRQDDYTTSIITTSKYGESSAVCRIKSDPDVIKSNMTPLAGPAPEAGKLNTSLINDGSPLGLEPIHDDAKLRTQVKLSVDHKNTDAGRLIGSGIPKRQRCSKGISTSLKCRKKGLQLSPSRPNYRRYKLLADVVC